MSTSKAIIEASRPKFLVLAPICVAVGISAAKSQGFDTDLLLCSLCILIALLAHACVNLLNEYHDAETGLDDNTMKTPFSGGSGALQKYPQAKRAVFQAGIVCAVGFSLTGVYLLSQVGWILIALGILGLIVIVAYTPWLNKSAWLCLFSPGTGFGLFMVSGVYLVFSEHTLSPTIAVCLPVFFLVNNLLLLNQFPDAKVDKLFKRNHFVIRYGYKKSAMIYAASAALAFTIITALVAFGYLPYPSLFALIGVPIAASVFKKAYHFEQENVDMLFPAMGANVMLALLVPLWLAICLFFF